MILIIYGKPSLFFGFIGAKPGPDEAAIYALLDDVLKPAEEHVASLKAYTGCGDAIRKVSIPY